MSLHDKRPEHMQHVMCILKQSRIMNHEGRTCESARRLGCSVHGCRCAQAEHEFACCLDALHAGHSRLVVRDELKACIRDSVILL